ncbi:site-specific integrase [soil metagenome]
MAGQITKRGEDTWQIRVFLGRDGNGKRKYFTQTIHGTKKLAQRELTKQLGKRDAGDLLSSSPVFLKDHIKKWLTNNARPRVKENTFAGYEWIANTYIIPKIGMYRMSELQARHEIIQDFYSELKNSGLSARTVRYTHSVLSSAMRSAVADGSILRNPCSRCALPRKDAPEMKYFTGEEVKLFLAAAKYDRLYTLFLLAVESGLRPGEYLGLQWKDVDFEGSSLSVRRSVKIRKGGGFYFTEPKTKTSKRMLPLSPTLITALRTHRRDQAEAIMKRRDVYQDHGLIFANELGLPILLENLRNRHFAKIIAAAGVSKIRLYDLRHTTATLLLSAGVHPKVVSERLGHASIVLTMDTYSHVLPTMQQDATDSIERLMLG